MDKAQENFNRCFRERAKKIKKAIKSYEQLEQENARYQEALKKIYNTQDGMHIINGKIYTCSTCTERRAKIKKALEK